MQRLERTQFETIVVFVFLSSVLDVFFEKNEKSPVDTVPVMRRHDAESRGLFSKLDRILETFTEAQTVFISFVLLLAPRTFRNPPT